MENERNKPDCPLIGQDGNVFNIIGIASRTLKENGMSKEAKEMSSSVFASGSYNEAIAPEKLSALTMYMKQKTHLPRKNWKNSRNSFIRKMSPKTCGISLI